MDWILPPQAAYISLRWGACYGDGDGTGASWFIYPSVKQSFGDKFAGLAINQPATAVRSLGRYNIQNVTYTGVPGPAGTNPSPWAIAHDGLGFDLTVYSDQLVRSFAGRRHCRFAACSCRPCELPAYVSGCSCLHLPCHTPHRPLAFSTFPPRHVRHLIARRKWSSGCVLPTPTTL